MTGGMIPSSSDSCFKYASLQKIIKLEIIAENPQSKSWLKMKASSLFIAFFSKWIFKIDDNIACFYILEKKGKILKNSLKALSYKEILITWDIHIKCKYIMSYT